MTLINYPNHFNRFINDFFNEPSVTRKITIDQSILAEKKNYSIYELPAGSYEVRLHHSDDNSSYYRASTKNSLDEAIQYVDDQVKYHSRQLEGPKKVWDGKENE